MLKVYVFKLISMNIIRIDIYSKHTINHLHAIKYQK